MEKKDFDIMVTGQDGPPSLDLYKATISKKNIKERFLQKHVDLNDTEDFDIDLRLEMFFHLERSLCLRFLPTKDDHRQHCRSIGNVGHHLKCKKYSKKKTSPQAKRHELSLQVTF